MFTRRSAVVAVAITALLTGCTTAAPGDAPADAKNTTVRFALDWTPNTNHTGLYVALAKGYFADAGIDVEVLPFNSSNPEVLVDAGQAEFGISFQELATMSIAAGAELQSVLAVQQTWTTEVAVLADRDDIQSPADLDGLVYGGFDSPSGTAIMKGVIRGAGGTGDFETYTLGTTAYEALYSGDVDFTVPFIAWEGIEAARRGIELKSFAYTDYGFPDSYQVIVVGSEPWLRENPKVARGFVQALARGYQDSIDDPAAAAQILQDENAGLLTDRDLLVDSQTMLAEKFMLDDDGVFGRQTETQWSELGGFLFDSGLLTDRGGKPLTEQPDWSTFFTNEYL